MSDPAAEEPRPASPTPAPEGDGMSSGARVAAGIGAVVLLFIALIAVLVVVDVGGTTICSEVQTFSDLNDDGECYDRSSGVKVFVIIAGALGALATLAAAGLALAYAIRGTRGRLLLQVLGVAVVLLALTMIIG